MTRIRCDGTSGALTLSPRTRDSRVVGYHPTSERVSVRSVREPRDRLAARLGAASLYLCTDARRERGDLAEFADAALAGGVDIIQLRDKGSPGEQRFGPLEAVSELAALEVLGDAARRHGALLAVNDRADVALAAGADVLHLGQDDLPLSVARAIVGGPRHRPFHPRCRPGDRRGRRASRLLLRRTVLADAHQARPPGARPRPGARRSPIEEAAGTDKPWFAIGGIDAARAAGGDRRRSAPDRRGARDHGRRRSEGGRRAARPSCSAPRVDHQRDRRGHAAQPLPARGEAGMQRQVGHLVLGDPAQFGSSRDWARCPAGPRRPR